MPIEIFETINIFSIIMVAKVWQLLDRFFLTQKIVAYIKDEGANLATCVTALNYVVSCKTLGMFKPFNESFFGHILFSDCQYIIINEKVV